MSEERKPLTLEQARTYRTILRVAFFLVAFVAPTLIIGFKFNLFTRSTTEKWSITGLTLLLIVAWKFKNKVSEWIHTWDNDNILKWIFIAIGKVWPFALIVAIIAVIHFSAQKIIGDVLFCLEWTCACELFAYIALYPLEMKMHHKVERLTRKKERKEDYKEAYNEILAERE